MIQKQLTTYCKVKQGSILIGYYESHVVGIRVIYGVGNIINTFIYKLKCIT